MTAAPSCFRLFVHWVRKADSRTFCTAGTSRPINTAMMPMTMSNSMSVNADRGRLRQVVLQLVENAVKYSPDGASVRVEARAVTEGGPLHVIPQLKMRLFARVAGLSPALARALQRSQAQ